MLQEAVDIAFSYVTLYMVVHSIYLNDMHNMASQNVAAYIGADMNPKQRFCHLSQTLVY